MKLMHVVGSNQNRGAETFAHILVRTLRVLEIDQSVILLKELDRGLNFRDACGYYEVLPNLKFIKRLFRMRRVIKQLAPDVIYCHGGHVAKLVIHATRFMSNKPRIVLRKIGMTSDWIPSHNKLRWAYHRWLYRSADLVLSLGPKMTLELIERLGVRPEHISHVDNFSDPGPYREAVAWADQRLAKERITLVVVGALETEKNCFIALRVFSWLVRERPWLRLKYVGDGGLRDKLEQSVRQLGLARVVNFTGFVDNVASELQGSDVMLMCSQTEGVPGVLIEAGYAALPTACWDVGDVRVIVDNKTAAIAAFDDVSDFAEAVRSVVDISARDRRSMGMQAREKCLERFTIDRLVAAHAALFAKFGYLPRG